MKKSLIVSSLLIILTACAGGPKESPEMDAIAKQFVFPTDGSANLYIYRNEIIAGGINMPVYIDGQRIAVTGPKTYIYKNLSAGEHVVEGEGFEGIDMLKISLIPNTINFIWQEVKMGILGARSKLHKVDEETGKKGVMESELLQNY